MSAFPYLHHGALDPESFGKVDCIWIGFRSDVPEGAREAIEAGCPAALAGFFRWADRLFYAETPGDVYAPMVSEEFGGAGYAVSATGAAAFSAAVAAWVATIDAAHPIAFVIGPGWSTDEDDRAREGRAAIPGEIVPWLEAFLDAHPELEDEAEEDDHGRAPIDRFFLSTIVQHLEADDHPPALAARIAALAARIEGDGEASDDF
ncbi:MAG: hypothetical protein K8W52_15955 [Deltaproteobacteria bacterium]|nr:hypothetical protein [Deltaproteobacteria bacterium]